MKITVSMIYDYVASSLIFSKDIDFDFVPFVGMEIIDGQNRIRIENINEMHKETWSYIYYGVGNNKLYIEVHRKLKVPFSSDTIEWFIKKFEESKWQMECYPKELKVDVFKKRLDEGTKYFNSFKYRVNKNKSAFYHALKLVKDGKSGKVDKLGNVHPSKYNYVSTRLNLLYFFTKRAFKRS